MIAQKKTPANVVYEDDEVMALLDINPIQTGHTLIIPKKHFVDIWDIEPAVLTKLITVTRQVANKTVTTFNARGIDFGFRGGKPAGRQIYHFHLHVIPLGKGERTRFVERWLSKVSRGKGSELDELARKLRI